MYFYCGKVLKTIFVMEYMYPVVLILLFKAVLVDFVGHLGAVE